MSTIELLGLSDDEPTVDFTAEEWLELFDGDVMRADQALLGLSDLHDSYPERHVKWTHVPKAPERRPSAVVDRSPWSRGARAPEVREGAFAD